MTILTPPRVDLPTAVREDRTVPDAAPSSGIASPHTFRSGRGVSGWRHGRVPDARIDGKLDVAGAKVYVAGAQAMVEARTATLDRFGLAAADIHADVFFTPETNDVTLPGEVDP